MRHAITVALFLFLCGSMEVMADDPENDKQIQEMSDFELKTEGAATRKPLTESEGDTAGVPEENKQNNDMSDIEKVKNNLDQAPVRYSFDDNMLSLGVGMLSGDLTHSIGGTGDSFAGPVALRSPSIETEIPLTAKLFSIESRSGFGNHFETTLSLRKSFASESEKAKGYEWGLYEGIRDWWADPNSLDVAWEGNGKLDTLALEACFRYRVYSIGGLLFSGGLGYLRNYYNFKTDYMYYDFPSTDLFYGAEFGDIVWEGMAREYEFIYDIPYVEIQVSYTNADDFNLEGGIDYSPLVNLDTEFRYFSPMSVEGSLDEFRSGSGSADGNAFLFFIEGSYRFYSSWWVLFQTRYSIIDTDGKENRYFSGLWVFDVEQEVEDRELYGVASIGYSF